MVSNTTQAQSKKLVGRRAVIVGTGPIDQGIGRACALRFALEGADIIAVDPSEQDNRKTCADIVAAGGKAIPFTSDLADEARLTEIAKQCAERWDKVDILVNFAGIVDLASVEECSVQSWERVIRIDLTGPLICAKAFLPLLKKSGKGSIIHIGSVDGILGNPRIPSYSAAKGGLIPLTHIMAHEFAKYNIRVNCLARAMVDSQGPQAASEYFKQLARATPLGRPGKVDEIAAVALFFASDESSYVTGAVLPVDGGRTGITPATA